MEFNKGHLENRTIQTQPVSAEAIGFPLAEQAALLWRQKSERPDELVALVTSAGPARPNAPQWLAANRGGWGLESGLHQRLDISHNDDRCRIRSPNGLWVMGLFRRLSNSLFMEWRSRQRRPEQKSTTDFQTVMEENNLERNGAKLRRNIRACSYLRLCTPGSFLRICSSVFAWSFATLASTRRLAAMACLATSYCAWDKA